MYRVIGEETIVDPVRAYLKDIGKAPLLTASQEVDLAMRLEGGDLAGEFLDSMDHSDELDEPGFRRIVDAVVLIREQQLDPARKLRRDGIGRETAIGTYRPGRQEAVEFLLRVGRDAKVAKGRLIEANLRLVVSIAKGYIGRGVQLLDVIQEGNLGLIRAVEKFDYRRGNKFSTYATWWIRQAVSRGIADQSRTIRLPVHVTEIINRLRRAQRDLTQRIGREPSRAEVAEWVGTSTETVDKVLGASRVPVSLQAPIGEDEGFGLEELIEDTSAEPPADAAAWSMLREEIGSVLDTLTERERRIIELRYGLLDDRARTLEEVGEIFHLTRERIRQIESKAMSKLRHPSRKQALAGYFE